MTVFQGIFQSEGTLEGRGPQPHEAPAGHTARGRCLLPARVKCDPDRLKKILSGVARKKWDSLVRNKKRQRARKDPLPVSPLKGPK